MIERINLTIYNFGKMNGVVVYLHKNKINNKVFYVGIGNKKRPYDFTNRNQFWKYYVKKYGKPLVEIYKDNLTKEEAGLIEIDLIKKYGRRNKKKGCLVNLSSGGEFGLSGVNEKQVLCLKKGIVYNSINEYCKSENQIQPVISDFLNRKKYTKKDYFVRLIINNKIKWIPIFDGDFYSRENIFSISGDKYYEENIDENKILIQDKFYKLDNFNKSLLYLLHNKKLTTFCKQNNLSYYKIYRIAKELKINLINKNEIPYNNILPLEIKKILITEYFNLQHY